MASGEWRVRGHDGRKALREAYQCAGLGYEKRADVTRVYWDALVAVSYRSRGVAVKTPDVFSGGVL